MLAVQSLNLTNSLMVFINMVLGVEPSIKCVVSVGAPLPFANAINATKISAVHRGVVHRLQGCAVSWHEANKHHSSQPGPGVPINHL